MENKWDFPHSIMTCGRQWLQSFSWLWNTYSRSANAQETICMPTHQIVKNNHQNVDFECIFSHYSVKICYRCKISHISELITWKKKSSWNIQFHFATTLFCSWIWMIWLKTYCPEQGNSTEQKLETQHLCPCSISDTHIFNWAVELTSRTAQQRIKMAENYSQGWALQSLFRQADP